MITTMFFTLVPFQKGSVYHHPSCEAYREKGGGVLMSIILPNLNHTFIGPVPVPVPVPFFPHARLLGIVFILERRFSKLF